MMSFQTDVTTQNTENTEKTRTGWMQSVVIDAPGKALLKTVKIPEPGDDEVCIRLEGCGLCASNLPPWEGREWFSYPMDAGSPGHEGWGKVHATGRSVTNVQSGDRVTVLSHHAYAEYDIAPADQVVSLPDSLNEYPFPGEPLGCAMNIFRRCHIEPGMTVAVIGTGFLGLLLIQLIKSAGAGVIAISRSPASLKLAARFGADHVIPFKSISSIPSRVEEITKGNLCDRVVEAAGKQQPLDLASLLTSVKGRLIIAGYHQDGIRKIDMQLWNWRGLDVINAHERDPKIYLRGIKEAIEAVENGVLKPFSLFTHSFPYKKIQQAFEMQQEKPEGFIKALILFQET